MTDPYTASRDLTDLSSEYMLFAELGRGATAVVYRGRDRALQRDVAIKVVHPRYAADADKAIERLEREARTAARLQHPNIVAVYAVRRLSDGGLALVMQLVPGRTLKQVLVDEGSLDPARAERILHDIAGALSYAHAAGVIHRDVKPENIFLDVITDRALLSDFGIAHSNEESRLTLTGAAIGTPAYMAPEQIDGAPADARSDVYSLGLVAWEMLVGERPWEGEALYNVIYKQKHEELPAMDSLRPGVIPPRLQYIIERAIQKKPAARWAGVDGLLSALDRWIVPTDWAQWEESHRRRRERERELAREQERERERKSTELLRAARKSTPESSATIRIPRRPGAITPVTRTPGSLTAQGAGRVTAPTVAAAALSAVPVAQGSTALVRKPVTPTPPGMPAIDETDAAPSWASTPVKPRWRQYYLWIGALLTLALAGGAAAYARNMTRVNGLVAAVLPQFMLNADGGFKLPAFGKPGPAPTDADASKGAMLALRDSLRLREVRDSLFRDSVAMARFQDSLRSDSITGVLRRQLWAARQAGSATEGSPDGPVTTPLGVKPGAMSATAGGSGTAIGSSTGTAAGAATGAAARGPAAATRAQSGSSGTPATFVSATDDPGLIAAGGRHTCTVRGGRPFCWGADDHGQLGDGRQEGRGDAQLVSGGLSFAQITAGTAHSCGVTRAGAAWCWGSNDHGQLGTGNQTAHDEPSRVTGGLAFQQLHAGRSHTCGLSNTGMAYCWGGNGLGQLGDGSTADRYRPVAVSGGIKFISISTGWNHSCGISNEGVAYCWGANDAGQLGNASRSNAATPVRVSGDQRFTSISAGSAHTCAVNTSGNVLCWGRNSSGQLGIGGSTDALLPAQVLGSVRFASVSVGSVHSCARTASGQVWCWGRNIYGQVGDGTNLDRDIPTRVNLPPVTAINTSGSHSCGVGQNGEVWCWGYNIDGQLGDGTHNHLSRPTAVRVDGN